MESHRRRVRGRERGTAPSRLSECLNEGTDGRQKRTNHRAHAAIIAHFVAFAVSIAAASCLSAACICLHLPVREIFLVLALAPGKLCNSKLAYGALGCRTQMIIC